MSRLKVFLYRNTQMVRFLSLPMIFWCVLLPYHAGCIQNPVVGAPEEIVPRECLAIKPIANGRFSAIHTDPIEYAIVTGVWKAPQDGDFVSLPAGGTQVWRRVEADKPGVFHSTALSGGYAYVAVEAQTQRVMILEASAHNMVYVNGEPRTGDVYQTGTTRLPVLLRKGKNDLLFSCGRDDMLQVKLVAPVADGLLDTRDSTLPDLRPGVKGPVWGAVVVINATDKPLKGLSLRAERTEGGAITTPLPDLLPLSTRKVGFRIDSALPSAPGPAKLQLTLLRRLGAQQTLDTTPIELRVRATGETYKETFISDIDGSVQYYAVNPARPLEKAGSRVASYGGRPQPALVLSLHGASVEAIGQADAYESKSWCDIVAPTNRRPYGYDWEDWGSEDAMEVLDLAQARLHTDPLRTYLTGHSMGGHGTWHVGVTYPDRFAAIGPSAGWISFSSYAGAKRPDNPTPMQDMLYRSYLPGDTLALVHNTAHDGVYIIHGSADDNVPPTEARTMTKVLSGFHHDWVYFEQPGAGHWWDMSDEPGADCVDWAPLFDFFGRHQIPTDEDVRQVDFVTSDPGVSAWSHWVGIEAQIHPLKPSSVSIRFDPGKRRFIGTTDNVARLAFRLDGVQSGSPLAFDLDGQKLENVAYAPKTTHLYLVRNGQTWSVSPPPSSALKGPLRNGLFRQAFRRHMLFVYGTTGTPEENAWAFTKARYDAELFWYRGNGSIDIVADTAFNPNRDRDRSVILYGNADTNKAWAVLLGDSPVQVRRGKVSMGDHSFTGEDLACLFVRPRAGSDKACVGVVSGAGLPGMRLTTRQPYLSPGVGYPDCLVLSANMLKDGDAGMLAAGFFGNDWRLENGEFMWK